jgi:hypothetical protein
MKPMDVDQYGYILIDIIYRPDHETFCIILRDKIYEKLVVCFRGTSCGKHWTDNLNYTQTELDLGDLSELDIVDGLDINNNGHEVPFVSEYQHQQSEDKVKKSYKMDKNEEEKIDVHIDSDVNDQNSYRNVTTNIENIDSTTANFTASSTTATPIKANTTAALAVTNPSLSPSISTEASVIANPDSTRANPDSTRANHDSTRANPGSTTANPNSTTANPDSVKANTDSTKANLDSTKDLVFYDAISDPPNNLDTHDNQLNNTRKFQKESYHSCKNHVESSKNGSKDLPQNHTDINHKYNDVDIDLKNNINIPSIDVHPLPPNSNSSNLNNHVKIDLENNIDIPYEQNEKFKLSFSNLFLPVSGVSRKHSSQSIMSHSSVTSNDIASKMKRAKSNINLCKFILYSFIFYSFLACFCINFVI